MTANERAAQVARKWMISMGESDEDMLEPLITAAITEAEQAVRLEEREACARTVEQAGNATYITSGFFSSTLFAQNIRDRSRQEKEQTTL